MTQPFIVINMKRTEHCDVGAPIRKFLNEHYSQTQVDENCDYVDKFAKLRSEVERVDGARHENTVTLLFQYLTYLRAAGRSFPINPQTIRLKFTWYDFVKTSKKVAHYDPHFEEACVLFNLAAFYSQLGGQQLRTSEEGLKKAALYFQTAAGLFAKLRDEILTVHIMHPLTVDMSVESVNVLEHIMLAQAQECFYEKASGGSMSDTVIAKLCAQIAEYYGVARNNLMGDKLKGHFDKSWVQQVELRFVYFKSIEQQRLAQALHEDDETGDEISRLQHAGTVLQNALKANAKTGNAITISALQQVQAAIGRALQIAVKENNTIYHHRVRPFQELPVSEKANVVKGILPAEMDTAHEGPIPFHSLVPIHITQATDAFMRRFRDMYRQQIEIVKGQTDIYTNTLTSIELPHSVTALSQPDAGLPPDLTKRIEAIQGQGALGRLEELFNTVQGLAANGQSGADAIRKMLEDEAKEDSEMKARFGAKWNRIPSAQSSARLTDELTKLQNHLNHAASSDQMVREKFQKRKINLEQLNRPVSDLNSLLPPAVPPTGPVADAVAKVQELLDTGAEMIKEREILEDESRSTIQQVKDSIVNDVITGASESKSQDSIFEDKVNLYRAWERRSKENLARQATHLEAVKASKQELDVLLKDSDDARMRGSALKQLNATVADYNEVSNNLREGIEFYTEFSDILNKLKSSASDWVFARQTERKDLMAVIQESITSGIGNTTISGNNNGGGGGGGGGGGDAFSNRTYNNPVPSHHSHSQAPSAPPANTGTRFDPHTGQPIQPLARFDPETGQPIQQAQQAPPPRFDPQTGQPLARFDPQTGQPLARFDPQTGQPL